MQRLMLMKWFGQTALVLALTAAAAVAGDSTGRSLPGESVEPTPVLAKSEGQFKLLKNWTFGNNRTDATIRNRADLDREFHYRYIYENGKLDKLDTYWSYHRDYPDGDPRSLHVFGEHTLTLTGRIPPGGGLRDRGIESGMLRAKIPVTPGTYIEMRAKLPGGVGVWPAFWLASGVEYPDGTFTKSTWLAEIDIFEFENWPGHGGDQTRLLWCNIQTFGKPARYGNPRNLFSEFKDIGWAQEYDTGFDCSKDFHVFALDWVENKPIWLLDGKPIKQTWYEWHEAPAHILVTNQIGWKFPNQPLDAMKADEKQWDYEIDYIRVWKRSGAAPERKQEPQGP